MLDELRKLYGRQAEFCVPTKYLNNINLISRRVRKVPTTSQSALRSVLSYLYLTEGPTNLRNDTYRIAEPYLTSFEILLSRYLKSRTNGSGRRAYGKPALHHMRNAGYKCECCGRRDVRALNLDHAHGRTGQVFLVLCASCHSIKSRRFDWSGKKRVTTTSCVK